VYTNYMLNIFSNFKKAGLLDDIGNFIDIGAQQIWRNTDYEIENFISTFGGSASKEEISGWFKKFGPFPPARFLFDKINMPYDCLDSSAETRSSVKGLNFDLNFDQAPDHMREVFDFVCDIGTLEHVFNQENSFNVCHDLTKPGGQMLHYLPSIGFSDAAYFHCLPRLYADIAEQNEYEEDGMWYHFTHSDDLVEWDPEILKHVDLTALSMHSIDIVALWRRTSKNKFKNPVLDEKSFKLSGYKRHIMNILCDALKYDMIKGIKSVADLGEQPVSTKKASSQFKEFISMLGGQAPDTPVTNSASMYEAAGVKHRSISLSDIASDQIAKGDEKYDFVTNLGVSDKIFNFGRVFQRMHEITEVGGTMMHVVPFFGNDDNSYYSIMPTLMEEMAIVNGYRILGAWLYVDGMDSALFWDDNHFRWLDLKISNLEGNAYYIVLFNKRYDSEFNIPFQFKYRGLRSEETSQRYHLNLNGENVVDWPLRKVDSRRELVGRVLGQYAQRPLTKPRSLYRSRFLSMTGAKKQTKDFL